MEKSCGYKWSLSCRRDLESQISKRQRRQDCDLFLSESLQEGAPHRVAGPGISRLLFASSPEGSNTTHF